MTTAGAGNDYPVGQLTRSLVTAQLIFDLATVTTAVSVVSGRLQSLKARREANDRA